MRIVLLIKFFRFNTQRCTSRIPEKEVFKAVSYTHLDVYKRQLIAISMGNTGSISRISGENFGSCLTFATVGKASAPGQFPVKELRMMMEALHEKNKE